MAFFEVIKDIDGKNYLSLDDSKNDDSYRIGSKFDDFEILQKLGEGAFGVVYKVCSRLNNNIYAMKKINIRELREENEKAYQLALNETEFLSELTCNSNQPNIIKYYKHFVEGDFLYIIIEFIENGDMDSFIEAHQQVGQHIPEEELWNIFLQCMKGLAYVHKMGVIHRDIKPANLLMDNNMTIKLGDFGVSAVKINENDMNTQYRNANYNFSKASDELQYHGTVVGTRPYMAKELIEENEYDQKVDVYAMGVSFYEMCYYHVPKKVKRQRDVNGNITFVFMKVEKPEDANVHYSNELLNIINLMLEEDKDKRQTSKYFLEMIKKEFSKKYTSNTSIDAIMRCLYSFTDLTKYYISLKGQITQKPVTKSYIACLNSFTKATLKDWYDSIKYFRELLCTENSKFDKAKEIDPKLVLAFLIHKLHNEINDNVAQYNRKNKYYMNSGEEKAKTSNTEMLINYGNEFLTKFNSVISKKFLGLIKITDICNVCKIMTFSFSSYLFATFDLEKFINQNMISGAIDIEKCFFIQNNFKKMNEKYCIKCLSPTSHSQFKNFYSVPDFLIISIQRGVAYAIKYPVIIKEVIDLSNSVELGGKRFKFVGCVNRNYDNEKYYSVFCFNNSYYKCEGLDIKTINPQGIFKDSKGELIMAFYASLNY